MKGLSLKFMLCVCVFFLLKVFFESLTKERGSFLKPFIQSGCIIASLLFGLSRVRDHMHHWHDILAGFLLGGFIAVYMVGHMSQWYKIKNFKVHYNSIL